MEQEGTGEELGVVVCFEMAPFSSLTYKWNSAAKEETGL